MAAKVFCLVVAVFLGKAYGDVNASVGDASNGAIISPEAEADSVLKESVTEQSQESNALPSKTNDDDDDDDSTTIEKEPLAPKFLASRGSSAVVAVSPVASSPPSLEMTMAGMEEAVMQLMAGKTAFGATPMGGSVKKIIDVLTKTMMPAVIAAHKADQKTLDDMMKEVRTCRTTKDSSVAIAKGSQRTYFTNGGLHKRCRGNEVVAYMSKKTCLQNQRNDYRTKVMKCDFFARMGREYGTTKNNVEIVKKAGSEATEVYITRISNTICGRHIHGDKGEKKAAGGWGGGLPGSRLDKFLRAKDACEKAKAAWVRRVAECKTKARAYSMKRKQCNQFQNLMDSQSCKHAVMVKDACEAYAGCYRSKLQIYNSAVGTVVSDEQDRKAEWRGLKRMECLMKAFADNKVSNAEIDACKGTSYKPIAATAHLRIKYPTIPKLQTCALPKLYPSTAEYKVREFKPLPVLAKGLQSPPCSGMVTIPSTPAPGSPETAKCTRVALNGFYSAGALLKCTNGYDVRRSFDKNSCPHGTKIFSPATRADWKTFLASAEALNAPHFIVDVTRPQNSCGGCRTAAMNSRESKQKSWVTHDGSPWWLASTKRTQPDGDYHANCFMHLYGLKNENDVQFNDHNCGYHSKSYYCQPMDLSLKPMAGSPKSCKCTKVDLAGEYTAGVLVKCEGCLDVSKATQKNSCPDGMKIFSPANKDDWKTFLNSAGPLRAPNWIIDITRPQNGCGEGCTKFSMKSTTPQQATWRTADGSPWWLRSTVHNQPDGDYTANCYMKLSNAASADTLQFNDHNCNYHSRSYYCQPTIRNHVYKWQGTKPKALPKKVARCARSKTNGAGGCYAGNGKTRKANALQACESVYGANQCSDNACGRCNGRGYHKKGVDACGSVTIWNYRDTSTTLGCDWKQEFVMIRTGSSGTWKPASVKFDLSPKPKNPLCRTDACVRLPFDFSKHQGILHNFAVADLYTAGWKVFSNQAYSHHTKTSDIKPNRGECLLWGSAQSTKFTHIKLGAMGRRTKIENIGQPGGWENGVYWYIQPGKSNGFAPNQHVTLNSADTSHSGGSQNHLSWHLNQPHGGYRSGDSHPSHWRKIVMYGPCKAF